MQYSGAILNTSILTGVVRLVGGSCNEGRLEVYYSGQWGTVCDDGFTSNAAIVFCRMMGKL